MWFPTVLGLRTSLAAISVWPKPSVNSQRASFSRGVSAVPPLDACGLNRRVNARTRASLDRAAGLLLGRCATPSGTSPRPKTSESRSSETPAVQINWKSPANQDLRASRAPASKPSSLTSAAQEQDQASRALPNQRNRRGLLACGQREISRGRSQTVACSGGGSTPRRPTGTGPPWVHPDGRGDRRGRGPSDM
jgi:hypothetical protein